MGFGIPEVPSKTGIIEGGRRNPVLNPVAIGLVGSLEGIDVVPAGREAWIVDGRIALPFAIVGIDIFRQRTGVYTISVGNQADADIFVRRGCWHPEAR